MTDGQVRLVESVFIAASRHELVLTNGMNYSVRIRGHAEWLNAVRTRLENGWDETDLVGDKRMRRLVGELEELNWLTRDPSRQSVDEDRLARQYGYLTLFGASADEMQRRLSDATVALLGVGGIGSIMAENLAAAGVGRIVAVDHDIVAMHNLNRQLAYGVDDVGRPKVQALRQRVARLAPRTLVEPVQCFVHEEADLDVLPDGVSVVAIGADEPTSIAETVWRWCMRRGVVMTRAAVGHERGYWGPLLEPGRGCLACFERLRESRLDDGDRLLEQNLSSPTPWSLGATNTVIAAWAAHDVLEYLMNGSCRTLNRRAFLNFASGTLQYLDSACACASGGSSAESRPVRSA